MFMLLMYLLMLELFHFTDIRGHFHDCFDMAIFVEQGSGVNDDLHFAAVSADAVSSPGAMPGDRVSGSEPVAQLAARKRNTLTRTMLRRLVMGVKRSGLG